MAWHYDKDETARVCLECQLAVCVHEAGEGYERCPLERAERERLGKRREMPEGYVTLRTVAERLGVSMNVMRYRVRRGEYPGARKWGEGVTAPWIVPEEALSPGPSPKGRGGAG